MQRILERGLYEEWREAVEALGGIGGETYFVLHTCIPRCAVGFAMSCTDYNWDNASGGLRNALRTLEITTELNDLTVEEINIHLGAEDPYDRVPFSAYCKKLNLVPGDRTELIP